jgi:hypothetical protein
MYTAIHNLQFPTKSFAETSEALQGVASALAFGYVLVEHPEKKTLTALLWQSLDLIDNTSGDLKELKDSGRFTEDRVEELGEESDNSTQDNDLLTEDTEVVAMLVLHFASF